MQDLYTYEGKCSGILIGDPGKITLYSPRCRSKPPCMIEHVGKELMEYLYDLELTDYEERYIDSKFCFGSRLDGKYLHFVEIPSTDDKIPAKVVGCDPETGKLVIFGPKKYIALPDPPPMTPLDYSNFETWKLRRCEFRILPDPVAEAEVRGRNDATIGIAYRMFHQGMEAGDVARLTGMSAHETRALRAYYSKNKAEIIAEYGLGKPGNAR